MHTPTSALAHSEAAHLLQVDRATIRRQALTKVATLNECVACVAEHAHRCHNAVAHAPAGINSSATQTEGA